MAPIFANDYQTIKGSPTKDRDDLSLQISSQGNVDVDQDLREKANSVRRHRSLFGIAALCSVGALGLVARTRNGTVDIDTDVSLLRSGVEVEVEATGTEVAVLSTDQYSLFKETANGKCSGGGPTKIPTGMVPFNQFNDPKDTFGVMSMSNATPPLCRAKDARKAFTEGLGTVGGKALENTKVMEKVLKKIFTVKWAAIAAAGGVWLGLGLIVFNYAYDYACTDPHGLTPFQLQITDNIAEDVVNKKVLSLAGIDFNSILIDIKTRFEDGFDPDELRDFAQTFNRIALQASEGGYQATLLCSNAAMISISVLNWLREQSHTLGDTDCCGQAAARIVIYREQYVKMGKRLKASFEAYKKIMLDRNRWTIKYRNRWACAEVYKGGYYNQYTATLKGLNDKEIAHASSQTGWSGSCPSNGSKQNEARANLYPKVEARMKQVESETFTADFNKFYDDMAVEISVIDC